MGFLSGLKGGQTPRQRQLAAERAEVEAEQARRESVFNNLVKQGMDPGTAELVMTNPEAFGQEIAARYGVPATEPMKEDY